MEVLRFCFSCIMDLSWVTFWYKIILSKISYHLSSSSNVPCRLWWNSFKGNFGTLQNFHIQKKSLVNNHLWQAWTDLTNFKSASLLLTVQAVDTHGSYLTLMIRIMIDSMTQLRRQKLWMLYGGGGEKKDQLIFLSFDFTLSTATQIIILTVSISCY